MKYISRTVWTLSLISLFTDMASEMLYPIIPIYLKSIGMYAGFQSICTMIASTLAGLIWYAFDANTAFIITELATILVILYFLIFIESKPNNRLLPTPNL